MADLVLITLIPSEPRDAIDWNNDLQGLKISVFELTVADSQDGLPLGIADKTQSFPILDEIVITNGELGKNILQHFDLIWPPFPPLPLDALPWSVATAVVKVNLPSPHPEFPSPKSYDLRIAIERDGQTLSKDILEYNITVYSPSSLSTLPEHYFEKVDEDPVLRSAYIKIPPKPKVTLNPGIKYSADGQTPVFGDLVTSINAVLAKDTTTSQPNEETDLHKRPRPLTPKQCRQIAWELTYDRGKIPLPLPKQKTLEQMFTGKNKAEADDQDRKKFEGDLTGYHAVHDAEARSLVTYIFAASAAIECERLSWKATEAAWTFPIVDTQMEPQDAYPTLSVILNAPKQVPVDPNRKLNPTFVVPAAYFYALGCIMPPELPPLDRYRAALLNGEVSTLRAFETARDNGVLKKDETTLTLEGPASRTMNLEQASRRLWGLGHASGSLPNIDLAAPVSELVQDWLDYASQNESLHSFWFLLVSLPAKAQIYLELLLQIITAEKVDLKNAIKADSNLSITTAHDLFIISDKTWRQFFLTPAAPANNNSSLLPSYTEPGDPRQRTEAFIARLNKLFDVKVDHTSTYQVGASSVITLEKSHQDALGAFFQTYGPLDFSDPLDDTAIEAALETAFADDEDLRAWVKNAITTIHFLTAVTKDVTPPTLQFSCMEALYCRGFSTADRIAFLSDTQFQNALAGSVAYPSSISTPIFDKATELSTGYHDDGPEPRNGFMPINPGNLVDCVPPENLSPLCSMEYAHQLLQIPVQVEEEQNDASITTSKTVADILEARRGDVSNLKASWANYNTSLPAIDLVLESLEYLGQQQEDGFGKVYDTGATPFADIEIDSKELVARDLFRAKPGHSSPSVPVSSPQIYSTLSSDFSSPKLPYSQALDINRSYLQRVGLTRFDVMRTFRSAITEFPVAPVPDPEGFQSQLWRLPIRPDVAIEYLSISMDENRDLFTSALTYQQLMDMYAMSSSDEEWANDMLLLPIFLKRLGISYCEFKDLRKSGFIEIRRQGTRLQGEADANDFPACEPCCGENIILYFGTGEVSPTTLSLAKLAVFVRLWRHIQGRYGKCFSMSLLATICNRLQLFLGDNDGRAVLNPDFLRQLIALLMLKDFFDVPLKEEDSSTAEKKVWLLDLWTTDTSSTEFKQAAQKLLVHIERNAQKHYKHANRRTEGQWLHLNAAKRLARLVGFPDTMSWYANPASTLRFAEVLVKVYQSKFSVGELLFIFTNGKHITGDDPFPQEERSESVVDPLNVPEDDLEAGLWNLRAKLLAVNNDCLDSKEVSRWSWSRIEGTLNEEFGFKLSQNARDTLRSVGTHFFSSALEAEGLTVTNAEKQFRVKLPNTATSAAIWNCPPYHPFHYDSSAEELWVHVPIQDDGVLRKLANVRQLRPEEQAVVRSLYFMPRALLAPFACLFPNFEEAVEYLCHEECEADRWAFFQRAFAVFHERCHVIAQQLSSAVCGKCHDDCGGDGCCDEKASWLVLKSLFADENRPTTPWEQKTGESPNPLYFKWDPFFSGSAFSALLGLVGTGLHGKYTVSNETRWHDITGSLSFFGCERDELSTPVPTILPNLGIIPTIAQQNFVVFKNGFALEDATAKNLGGAEGFKVTWSGVLLIEKKGDYHFKAVQPCPKVRRHDACDRHDACNDVCDCHDGVAWSVKVKRGPKHWTLKAAGTATKDCDHDVLHACLSRGAYDIVIEFEQHPSTFTDESEVDPGHTGFVVTYSGPDTCDSCIPIPADKLFIKSKEGPLIIGKENYDPHNLFLRRYFSTLRDIRRTYQRAFKAILFTQQFCLSARQNDFCDCDSELGLLLRNPADFVGTSYYIDTRTEASRWTFHRANFDLNFLPVDDEYLHVTKEVDDRAEPSDQRMAALFDWWERIFDYCQLREEIEELVRAKCAKGQLWTLFHEAGLLHGADVDPERAKALVRHLGVDMSLAPLVTRFFLDTTVSEKELRDERWAIRVWHAKVMLDAVKQGISTRSLEDTRPDLWASDDPNVETFTDPALSGNKNLTLFVEKSSLKDSPIPRLVDIEKLNDGLRIRAREALIEYLCQRERVKMPVGYHREFVESPRDLSALLLQEVEVGSCQYSTRIEDAVGSIHTLIQRICLGLEPSFSLQAIARKTWEEIFSSFDKWECWQRRRIYLEDWVEWKELHDARKSEAFPFFEKGLRRNEFNRPESTPPFIWTAGQGPTTHMSPIQGRELAIGSAQRNSLDEGLRLMAAPFRHGRQTLLARVNVPPSTNVPDPDDEGSEDSPSEPEPTDPLLLRRLAVSRLPASLPLWVQAAIRLGTRFVRVAAAGLPPGIATALPHESIATQATLDMSCGSCKCGVDHPPVVDEYYFWLVDGRRFESEDATQDADVGSVPPDPTSNWDRPQTLPSLLHWVSQPIIHLAWTRVHFGTFDPPRRSAQGLNVTDADGSSLNFDGRRADSLLFSISNSVGGFRYDLATDEAVTFPQVVSDEFPEFVAPAPLPAYPYFVYFEPGAPLFPINSFATGLATARSRRMNCKYEEALTWLRATFDPLSRENVWAQCRRELASRQLAVPELRRDGALESAEGSGTSTNGGSPAADGITPGTENGDRTTSPVAHAQDGELTRTRDNPCCATAPVKLGIARGRAVALEYVQTLVDWGDQLMCKGTRESRQQASTLFHEASRILGPQPLRIDSQSKAFGESMTLSRFRASIPALNPRLLELYDKVGDRHGMLSTCVSNDGLCADGSAAGCSSCLGSGSANTCYGSDECLSCCAPYRFTTLLPKAMEHTNAVKALASALLSALEKGDAEYLGALRTAHERQLLSLNLENKQAAFRESDWSVQALEKQMQSAQTRLRYYQELIKHGLNQGETGYLSQTQLALASRTASSYIEGTGQLMNMIPDISLGGAGVAGSPLNVNVLPIGTKLSMFFQAISRILNILADNASTNAGISTTVGGWDRRLEEWMHQVDVITLEIAQLKRQTLAAHRRRQMSLRDLNHHQRSIDHSGEIQEFMRDKLSKQDLYTYLQQETAALYRETYELAVTSSKEALRAFRNERPDLAPKLHIEAWNDLHEGLMSGERLEYSLRAMERTYLSAHCREYELAKYFSLRLHFPLAFLQLKAQGWCEVDIPEWMFDLDYPGHYMRRIRNVTVTIPCVVGPYVGIHCKLQLLRSSIRTSPSLARPATCCCDTTKSTSECGPGDVCYNDFTISGDNMSAPRRSRRLRARTTAGSLNSISAMNERSHLNSVARSAHGVLRFQRTIISLIWPVSVTL
jgi:hypothetical protein